MNRILYLHGFASGPQSRKAGSFSERLRAAGAQVDVPDLAAGNFRNLTITGQLAVIEKAARGEPVSLIGSSMGGYLAALYASHHSEVDKVVLLAPAFYFPQRWEDYLGSEKMAEWKRTRAMSFFHYSDQCFRDLDYALVEDGLRYPPAPDFGQPALIFHGRFDDTVPSQYSVEYAAAHPNVRLRLLDSGHELTDVLDIMWAETKAFLLPA